MAVTINITPIIREVDIVIGSAGGGAGVWGAITGTLSAQTDLATQQGVQDTAIALNTAKVTYPSADSTKLAGIEALAEVNTVDSVNTLTGAVVLEPDDIPDRVLTNATVTTTQNLDYALYEQFDFTLTGATTLTESNTYDKVIILNVSGAFALTLPALWSTNITGSYDTATQNTIVVWKIGSAYKVQISQPD